MIKEESYFYYKEVIIIVDCEHNLQEKYAAFIIEELIEQQPRNTAILQIDKIIKEEEKELIKDIKIGYYKADNLLIFCMLEHTPYIKKLLKKLDLGYGMVTASDRSKIAFTTEMEDRN